MAADSSSCLVSMLWFFFLWIFSLMEKQQFSDHSYTNCSQVCWYREIVSFLSFRDQNNKTRSLVAEVLFSQSGNQNFLFHFCWASMEGIGGEKAGRYTKGVGILLTVSPGICPQRWPRLLTWEVTEKQLCNKWKQRRERSSVPGSALASTQLNNRCIVVVNVRLGSPNVMSERCVCL